MVEWAMYKLIHLKHLNNWIGGCQLPELHNTGNGDENKKEESQSETRMETFRFIRVRPRYIVV